MATAKQLKFVDEYIRNGFRNASAAYRKAYNCERMSDQTVANAAYDLTKHAELSGMIEAAKQNAIEDVYMTAKDVLRNWVDIATADPNDIAQYRRTCCRYCWGIGHAYQWVEHDYWLAVAQAIDEQRQQPDASGGFGWDATLDPAPGCPNCHGEGLGDVHVADTRKLKGKARKLYAGVKMTRNGPEILLRNQDAALANIAKHFGMLGDKLELTGADGEPLIPAANLTDDQLAAIIASANGITDTGAPDGQ